MRVQQQKARGVTLLETLVAGTVIVLVLLSLLGAISFALEGSRQAEGHDDATWYAQRLMEAIRERELAQTVGFSDPPTARIPLNAPPFDTDFTPDPLYTRRIVTRQVTTDPTDYRHKLYEITVTIYWKSKRRENSFQIVGLTGEP